MFTATTCRLSWTASPDTLLGLPGGAAVGCARALKDGMLALIHCFSPSRILLREMTSLAERVFTLARNNPTIISLLMGFLAYSAVKYHRSPWRRVPPGPKGLPLLGNALEWNGSMFWLKLTRWREVYGTSLITSRLSSPSSLTTCFHGIHCRRYHLPQYGRTSFHYP